MQLRVVALAAMLAALTGGVLPSPAAAAPTLSVTPSAAPPGGSVTLHGVGFVPNVSVMPVIQNGPGAFSGLQANCPVDASGTFDCTRTIPTSQAVLGTPRQTNIGVLQGTVFTLVPFLVLSPPTATPTATQTRTSTPTDTPTSTPTLTATPTSSPTPTFPVTPTASPTASATPTSTPSATPTLTASPVTLTLSPTVSSTPVPTSSSTGTQPSATLSPAPTSTLPVAAPALPVTSAGSFPPPRSTPTPSPDCGQLGAREDDAPPGYASNPAGLQGLPHTTYVSGLVTLAEREQFRDSLPVAANRASVNDWIARGCAPWWIRAHIPG